MGTSKTILLSGVCLMLGYYTLSFNSIEEQNFSTAVSSSSFLQSEQLAKTGISLALLEFGNDTLKTSIAENSIVVSGGNVTISANRPPTFPLTQTQVVATGQSNGEQFSMTAVFELKDGRWKILRVFPYHVS